MGKTDLQNSQPWAVQNYHYIFFVLFAIFVKAYTFCHSIKRVVYLINNFPNFSCLIFEQKSSPFHALSNWIAISTLIYGCVYNKEKPNKTTINRQFSDRKNVKHQSKYLTRIWNNKNWFFFFCVLLKSVFKVEWTLFFRNLLL